MPPRSRRLAFPEHSVTAVVVTHDGAAWLPECLAALSSQTRPPQQVVAVDTGSSDGSGRIAADTLGGSAVVECPAGTTLGAAVAAGLAAFAASPPPDAARTPAATQWVWILHDDCAPDPDALEQLLRHAAEAPSAGAVAPKALTWDRRHLLEVGVTVNSSGTRDTGLEPHEVDQGQHDGVGDVLAAGTAGLLVRHDVWDRLGGLDDTLGFAGDDVDLGWRINAAGWRVTVAPRAVVRHAAALTTGARTAAGARLPDGATTRLNGMRLVLGNTSPWLVAPLAARYLLESVLRTLAALVLLRSPRRARDELVALVALACSPQTVAGARRRRRAVRQRSHHELRRLLARPGRRWRHLADAVGPRRRHDGVPGAPPRRPVETGPVAADTESFPVDDGGVLRGFVTRPATLLTLLLVAAALVADRSVLGGALHGGRLLAPAAGASDLWHLYLADWHPVGLGSTTAAPPAMAVVALLSSVLLGKVWLAVDVLFLGAVPLAGLAAYAGSGAVTRRRVLRVAAAIAYAIAPPLTGAVAGGRLDVVGAAILAPLVMRALASAFRTQATPAAFGAGLLLAVAAAFAPPLWAIAVGVGLVVAVCGPRRVARARVLAVVALVPPAVLLPWTLDVIRSPRLLVAGLGLPEPVAPSPTWLDLLLVHPGGAAQPAALLWAPVVVGALLAVLTGRRAAAFTCLTYVAATGCALVVARLGYAAGAPLAAAAAGALAAGVAGLDVAPAALRRRAFGWRQAVVALVAAASVAATGVVAVAWLVRGADRPLSSAGASVLPVFAQAEAAAASSPRILVLRPTRGGLGYALLDGPGGVRLGEADVAPPRGAQRRASAALGAAVAAAAVGRSGALGELAEFGVTLVVVRDEGPAVGGLAKVDGLARVPATSSVVYRSSMPAGEAVVLSGSDAVAARAGRPLEATARPRPVAAAPGAVHARVARGTGPRLLVLARARSAAWHATLDGHRLTPVSAYGWAQAWSLPPGGGVVSVTRSDGGRGAILVVQGVLVALTLLSCVPVRRENP